MPLLLPAGSAAGSGTVRPTGWDRATRDTLPTAGTFPNCQACSSTAGGSGQGQGHACQPCEKSPGTRSQDERSSGCSVPSVWRQPRVLLLCVFASQAGVNLEPEPKRFEDAHRRILQGLCSPAPPAKIIFPPAQAWGSSYLPPHWGADAQGEGPKQPRLPDLSWLLSGPQDSLRERITVSTPLNCPRQFLGKSKPLIVSV